VSLLRCIEKFVFFHVIRIVQHSGKFQKKNHTVYTLNVAKANQGKIYDRPSICASIRTHYQVSIGNFMLADD
jgi:hypothetical protein